jgi:4-amino-4-deoxy-L-arabinose transferase-like glycosyltransferase
MRPFSRYLLLAIASATLLKLYLALASAGSLDTAGFLDHLQKIRALGVGAYRVRGAFDNPFNSPPPMIHVIRFWGWLADTSGLPFRFWLRLPSVLADVGSFFLVARWLAKLWPDRNHFGVLLCLALCPTAIIISGYHGNTDSVMIFLVLLCLYTMEQPWIAGTVFGLALCVKMVPLIFVPVILLYLTTWSKRFIFVIIAALIFLGCSLPYLFQDPKAILSTVLGYSSIYGAWGWSQLAVIVSSKPTYLHAKFDVQGGHAIFAGILKVVAMVMLIGASVWLNRAKAKSNLLLQGGLLTTIFLFMTPGYGTQYLIWLVPFVAAIGLRATALYYLTSGVIVVREYACVAFALCSAPVLGVLLGLICWLSLLAVLQTYRRQLKAPEH